MGHLKQIPEAPERLPRTSSFASSSSSSSSTSCPLPSSPPSLPSPSPSPNSFTSATKRGSGALACMVNAEISAVLAVMRRSNSNNRWGGNGGAGGGGGGGSGRGEEPSEHALIHALKTLRRNIFSWQQPWQRTEPLAYLGPFLDVVRSEEAGAPITGVALSAVYKFLTLEVFGPRAARAAHAMRGVVEAVTGCRFEVADPASEEVVLMKILHVLLACIRHPAARLLGDRDVCLVVNTCFRVVHQAVAKGELLQRTARHTMHEIIRAIFAHLPELDETSRIARITRSETPLGNGAENEDHAHTQAVGNNSDGPVTTSNGNVAEAAEREEGGSVATIEPYGVAGITEIFRYLCSLLNIVDSAMMSGQNLLTIDEDVPLFALGLINSSIELGGQSFGSCPELLSLIQDDLFKYLMQLGLSMNPLILSMVCSVVLNLYHHLRSHLKLQLEAFFSCVVIRLAQGRFGATYQQQEVAMEALVDFCRQPSFMPEMYANFDCDITCSNIFEELGNLLSKSAFPVNCPLSAMHILALDGLIAVIQSMAERATFMPPLSSSWQYKHDEAYDYKPFWAARCESYKDPSHWVRFVQRQKYVKRRLMIGADHFNRDPKKGLEFLQGIHLLPEKLDPQSVACFFRYTTGLDKSLLGDFLGDPDEFCLQVLAEFARTFDFQGMSLDAALRTFLEAFRLPGEAQKIQRVLEAFAERYYEQSSQTLADKDVAFVLAYSLIILNTDQHNSQVRKKMTEEDFIKNNRNINAGQDLPREYLSELYHSIVRNEIKMSYDSGIGFAEMTPSRWIGLLCKSQKTAAYITCDSRPFLDHSMFAIISGPTIAAVSVVFDHSEDDEVLRACVDGFLAIAKISASHHLEDVLDDLVVSLCKFTTLANPSMAEEPVIAFGDDTKARMACVTVFNIANKYGDFIRTAWRNVLDCVLRLHKLGLLPPRVASDAADDAENAADISMQGRATSGGGGGLSMVPPPPPGARRRTSGLMGRFSQLLSLEADEPRSQPSEQQLAAHQRTLRTIEACRIDGIFTESKFLHPDSLVQLARALVWAAGRPQKGAANPEDEDTAVFCLELSIALALNNRDRIGLVWPGISDHIAGIIQTAMMPSLLVEKAVFGLLRVCQRLLPYKEELAEELLRSLQLVLKLDGRVAEAFCERIAQEVSRLVRANAGTRIRSPAGWRTISSLLSITALHSEASMAGFDALSFIMVDGAHVTPGNFSLCLDAARAFAEGRVGGTERSLRALDLMSESVKCLVAWSKASLEDPNEPKEQELGEYWLRLAQSLKKMCLDTRDEVRNHAVLSLARCLSAAEGIQLPPNIWVQCFEQVIFPLLDDLLEIALQHSPKEFRNMESTLHHAMKLVSKIFLQFLDQLTLLPKFRAIWLGILNRMEKYMKAKLRGKGSEKLQELVLELLKNILLILHVRGVLIQRSNAGGGDSLWDLTWRHAKEISPSLQAELFSNMLKSEESRQADSTIEPAEEGRAAPLES